MDVTRRDALLLGGLGVAGVGALALPLGGGALAKSASLLARSLMPLPYRTAFVRPPVLAPTSWGEDDTGPYEVFDIQQRAHPVRILRTLDTPVLSYGGAVPGPTIVARRGTRVVARVHNRLPDVHPQWGHPLATSTHLHGSASLPQFDGYANDLTGPGYVKTYQWPNAQPARTLWYHDHAAHTTTQNVYSGLAAQYHLHDEAEVDLLPQGEFDVPLTISDAAFGGDGALHLDDRQHSGLWGDVVLVNGRPWPVLRVQRRVYRFRILNASVSRSYRPTLLPQGQLHVVATDGGLVPVSRPVTQWKHAPAERYEVLIDFRQYAAGRRVELRNLSNPNNRDYDHTDKIMAFDVTDDPVDTSDPHAFTIPGTLVPSEVMALTAASASRRRRMRLKHDDRTNEWSIDGSTWADVVASGYRKVFADPDLGDVEVWEIENSSGGWHHPMHLHLVDFRVLSRNGRAPYAYEQGPKDVVYVGERETVRIVMRFGPHRGRYMIHCHNLPHEDHDMMTQFRVGEAREPYDPDDPVLGAPPVPDED